MLVCVRILPNNPGHPETIESLVGVGTLAQTQPWHFQRSWQGWSGYGPAESSHGSTAPSLAQMVSSLSHFLSFIA